MEDYAIELEHVGCKVGHHYLLKNIDWKVKTGEHWLVFGMNGSGKTTLLSIIAGFKYFNEGRIKVFGQSFDNENTLSIRKKIGLVSASFFDTYYHHESALNIVLSGLTGTLGIDNTINLQNVAFAKELLTEFKLGERVNYPFHMFSKGERQNILIARALIANPEILILDEPCTGLDVYNRSYLFSTIEELSKNRMLTIIYVTHYVEEIVPLFDKALLLKKGQIYACGKTVELFQQENMKRFMGYSDLLLEEHNGQYHMSVETASEMLQLLEKAVCDNDRVG